MIKNALAIAIAAACMTSGAAFAQSYDYRNERDGRAEYQQRSNNYERRDDSDRRDPYRGNDYRSNDYRSNDYRSNEYRSNHYSSNDYRGSVYRRDRQNVYDQRYQHNSHRPYYQMRRGERVSQYYSGSHYVVRDWNRHRGLYAPHRGHQWVQVGNEYALVAIATGIIAQVLLSR